MARMAGEVFHQTMTEREKPIVPGFNNEDQLLSLSPLMPPIHFIKEALKGNPTAPGTMYEGPDPFNQNNKIRPSDSDDQFIDIMKSGFV